MNKARLKIGDRVVATNPDLVHNRGVVVRYKGRLLIYHGNGRYTDPKCYEFKKVEK